MRRATEGIFKLGTDGPGSVAALTVGHVQAPCTRSHLGRMMLAVPAKVHAVLIVVCLALASCKQTPQRRVETKQQSVAATPAPANAGPTGPKRASATPGRRDEATVPPGTQQMTRLSTRETPDEIVVVTPPRPARAPSPAPSKQPKVPGLRGAGSLPVAPLV